MKISWSGDGDVEGRVAGGKLQGRDEPVVVLRVEV